MFLTNAYIFTKEFHPFLEARLEVAGRWRHRPLRGEESRDSPPRARLPWTLPGPAPHRDVCG